MTMPIVARNEIRHSFFAAERTSEKAFHVFFGNKVIINPEFGFDSSHNLDCLLHDFIASCAHKLVGGKGIEPLSVQCE